MKKERFIEIAKLEIKKAGWSIQEFNENGQSHLEFTKEGNRRAWGMLETVYCWTEAYTALTKKRWLDICNYSE